ncbi:PREDICTED: uncharacterized protein LOC107350882 [Acropora digitifera]|uniref:uncharacterized protein LOC107350882 n=1 Tax=Acropora digitifera TaxID=70779 RepID=UPI00077A7375|nr:PREDICTED: uncharacterized protein LOC107350882 [Acropora digitifera]
MEAENLKRAVEEQKLPAKEDLEEVNKWNDSVDTKIFAADENVKILKDIQKRKNNQWSPSNGKKNAESYRHQSLPRCKNLEGEDLKADLLQVFELFASYADNLAPLRSTQPNESFNNLVSVHAPKHLHFSGSASLRSRVAFAVATKTVENQQYIHLTPYYAPTSTPLSTSDMQNSTLVFNLETSNMGRSTCSSAIIANNMLSELQSLLIGFINTLPILKKLLSDRCSYKQEELVSGCLNKTYDAHNGLEDVKS